MSDNPVYIYALIDPRTDGIRYVGQSVKVKGRLGSHRYEARSQPNTRKGRWFAELERQGLRPVLRLLEETTEGERDDAEIRHIAACRAAGCDLLNIYPGGSGYQPNRVVSGDLHPWRLHPELVMRGDRNPARRHPETLLRGERNHFSRIAEPEVLNVLRLYGEGVGPKEIAEATGICRSQVHRIVSARAWQGVSKEIDDAREIARAARDECGREKVLALLRRRAEGIDVVTLAREFRMSSETIRDILKGTSHSELLTDVAADMPIRRDLRGGSEKHVACMHGHEFTPENTYVAPSGARTCRKCQRAHVARYRARERAPDRY